MGELYISIKVRIIIFYLISLLLNNVQTNFSKQWIYNKI
jgi:hypothetical protein